ncbi:collagen binding domain-containing protein [uncultured Oscillibacter sp.]|uniref:collagen binding domain-containing protein n=1 Tax=uncultured Oscillibacter sp. TaxID=876091 RepID=UPI0026121A4E|nr:SpaA isopeptide-forming pilin-related protein [uncultured Oscillibacter sp.]
MLKSLSQSIKTKWKRALSGLLAMITVAGMLPATAFAAGGTPAASPATTPVYAPTGDFEVNIAGATGWNVTGQPLTVYSTESGSTQTAAIPATDGAAPIPIALLEYSGGERVKVGLAVDGSGSVTGWEGGKIGKTGWVDKKDIFINLPDVLPGIAYNRDGGRQFSSRLSRYEYVVPGSYALTEQLAQIQREAMADGDTLVVRQSGQTVSVSRAKGAPDQLYQYTLDGAVYQKYEDWTEYDASDDTLAALGYELPRAIDRAYSVIPYTTLTELCARSIKRAPVKASSTSPTGGTGGLNPGSPGGQKPTTSNVDWTTDPERTFLRFTLIEFPEGVVKDIGNNDHITWHVVGTPLNVVWGKGTYENWSAEQCRSKITWFNSSAMQYNGMGSNAAQMMAGGTGGIYSYDATSGYNQRWVTTADEFQAESGITDQQKEQMFHCNSSQWSTSWIDGDYTSMWGTDPKPVTPGNLYKVYKPNDAFLYLLGRLSENSSGSGWSKDEAIAKWSEYIHDASGNLRTKYRIIIETGGVFADPDGVRRAYTLREMMAYSLYNSETVAKGNLIWDQSSTIRNMAQWMRQAKGQFLEYPLNGDGTPTSEELCSTNGFTEADSFVDSITKAAKIRDTIFTERRSYGLHILSPFNFERPEPTGTSLEVTKKADDSMPADKTWSFTVTYTAGSPSGFTAMKNNTDCTNQVTSTGSGLKFSLKADETIRIEFQSDASFRFEVREDDSSQLTGITGTGGTADMAAKKFTSSGGASSVTFTNGTTITEKKPVYLKLKKIAATDKKPLSGAEFSVYADSSCSGTPLAVMTTGSDGTASTSVPNIIEDGGSVTLYVKETKAPAGCTPLASPIPVTCKAPDNSTQAGAAQVGPASGIENGGIPEPGKALLFKRDALTNTGVGPATFKFSSVTNGVYEFDTDEAGVLESVQWWDPTEAAGKYIKPGEYAVTELIPPPNYEPTTEVQQIKLELDANGNPIPAGPLVFKNLAKVGLKILKYDRQSHRPMSGVTFEIFRDGVSLGNYETNGSGEILLTGIEPGTYRAVEVDTGDDSHIKDTAPQEIELTAGCGIKELFFFNDVLPGMKLVKVDSADPSKTIPGVKFSIRDVDGSYGPQEFVTDSKGEIDLSKLPTGSYVVTELECPGYVVDNAQRIIHLRANDTAEFVFTNTKKPGLRLVKTSADGTALDGVTFKITPIGDASHSIDRTTQNGGEILVEGLEPGIYSVVETATLPDHILDTTEYHVELSPGKTAELRLSNDRRPSLIISKRDKDTTDPIPGVTFTLRGADGPTITTKPTGPDGKVVITDLLPGVYTVTEQSVPENYILNTTPQTVTLFPNKEAQVEFQNHQRPTLKIVKVDINGKHLTGAIFEIRTKAGVKIGDFPVGADGTITVPQKHLTEGYFIITEKQAPAGYILDTTPHEVYLRPGKTTEVSIENEKKPGLTIYKVDSIVGDGIKGAKFEIWVSKDKNQNGTYQQLTNSYYYSDENGIIHLDNLDTGWYKIVEVEPPSGFMLKEPSEQTIYIEHDTSVEVTFENIPKSALVIRKIDSDTGAPLANAWFRVRYLGGTSGSGGTIIGEYQTSSNGNIVITGLDAGIYVCEEISAPHGYVMDTAPQTAYISGKEQNCITLTFTNSKYGSLLVKKIDSISGELLSDIQFFITTSDGSVVGNSNGYFTTDSAGTILVSDIMPGTTLVVKETRTRPGYILDDVPQTVKIESNETKTLEFRNQPTGSLLIRKVCSVNPSVTLANAEFKVMYSDGSLIGDSNGVYRSDENGEVHIEGLTPGKSVVITETKAPAGFLIDTQSQTAVIQAGKTVSVTMKNQPKGQLIVQKRDSATNKPLPGAEFRITTAAGCEVGLDGVIGTSTLTQNGIFTTDANGEIRITNLAPGAYVLSEIKAPSGYVMDSPSTNVVIGPNGDTQTVIVKNSKAGTLVIDKRDSLTNKPLSGVTFKVTTAAGEFVPDESGQISSNGIYMTDRDGKITINGVVGTLVVTETKTIPGYVINSNSSSQTVVVNPNDVQTLYFYNDPLCNLTLTKRDSVTGKPVPNTEFTVRDGNGGLIGRYTTGKDGTVTVTGLVPGSTVVVTETKVPQGYVLNPTPQTIILKNGTGNSVVSGGSTGNTDGSTGNTGAGGSGGNNLDFENDPTTTLTIQKFVEGTDNQPMKGVEFLVTDSSGAVVGPNNGYYYTDKDGRITISNLEPGTTITARETKTLAGFVLDSTPQSIKIKVGEGQTMTFWNKKAGGLVITKLDAVSKEPLAGVRFKLTYSDGTNVDQDGGKVSTNGIYVTDSNGQINVQGVTGTIIVTEIETVPGYIIDPNTKSQTVKVNADDTQYLTFYNTPTQTLVIQKLVEGSKDQGLAGVEFLVTDSSGAFVGPNNGIYKTDKYGRITIFDLKPGAVITAKETKALDGYVLDSTPQSVEIKSGSVQTLTFYNTPVGGLELIKVSESDKSQRIKGVSFEIRRMDGGLVDTITTGDNGRVFLSMDAGDYYAVEIEAAEGFKIDSTPHYFTVQDGKTTTLTVTNAPFSGIIIHKVNSVTGEGIYDVKFLVYDQNKNPIGEYSTDNEGYIYIDDLTVQGKGKLFIRELEAAPGYELDKEYKTVYVQPGKTIEIEWKNTPITGQFQVYKYAAEYNEVTGTPAGAPLQGAVYEISEARSGKVVDYVRFVP